MACHFAGEIGQGAEHPGHRGPARRRRQGRPDPSADPGRGHRQQARLLRLLGGPGGAQDGQQGLSEQSGPGDGLFDLGPAASPPPAGGGSGGTLAGNTHASAPLAVRMRPRTLDELVGQQHLLAPGSPLRRLIEGDQPMSLLLWGPPGTGKTTIASIVSQADQPPVRRGVGGRRRRQGGPGRHRRCPAHAGPRRTRDGAVRRRGAPLHQGPAGRAAARGGEPLGDAGRGHHREPVLLGDLPAAVPLAAADPRAAHRRRHPRRDRRARWPTSAGSTAPSPSTTRRSTTWSGSPAGTPAGR